MTKQYSVQYLPIARKDLTEILQYLQKDSPAAALNFLNTFDETISKLMELPLMGQVPGDGRLKYLGYRMLEVGSCIVFYVVREDFVRIKRILQGRRKYSFLFQ